MLAGLLNKPGGRVSKGQQDEVLQLIRDNDRSITVVDCGKDVDDDFLVELCHALTTNRFVTTLRIRDKTLTGAMFALAQLCKQTTTLVSIKISYANLTDEDAQVLVLSLLKNASVQSLALDHNRISTVDAFVKLLDFNKTVDSLDLSYNNLGARGDAELSRLADALGSNRTLKQLYLSGNGLSDPCARRYVAVVDQNLHTMQLRVLDIAAENSVRPETKQGLKLILDSARQAAATKRSNADDADDVRTQLQGLGFTGMNAGRLDEPKTGEAVVGMDDVKLWQEQVEAANGRFDDERKELVGTIERLKAEKDHMSSAQIAALEQTNKLQQQAALLTERTTSLQRELTALTAKYDRKVQESGDTISSLQAQVAAGRRELVRASEVAARDRAELVGLQEKLTEELTAVHAQLAAAVRAGDVFDASSTRGGRATSGGTGKPVLVSVGTTTEGLSKGPAAPVQNHAAGDSKPGGASEREPSAWSSGSNDTSPAMAPRSSAAPTPLPKDQWLDDDAAADCRSCREAFSLTKRRHHCRLCGRVFCNRCAPEHKQWGMRACTFCIATHN